MPVTCDEKPDSPQIRSGDKPTATFYYVLRGTSSDTVAQATAESKAPMYYGGLKRQEVSIEAVSVDTVSDTGVWDVTAEYTAPEYTISQTGDSSYAFDTGGGTKHIIIPTGPITGFPAGAPPAMGIGDLGDGNPPAGVDVFVPGFRWSETHHLADAAVTEEYKGKLLTLSPSMNSAKFRGCEPGEALFLNASGAKSSAEKWAMTFHFAAARNRKDWLVPGTNIKITKRGWDHMWPRWRKVYDADAKADVMTIVAVYVAPVYEEADLSQLGIGP